MVTLPNNPQEFRVRAKLYAYLANTAEIPEDKEHFGSLANSLMKLADDIEGALILLRTLDDIEIDEPQSGDEDEYSEAA